MHKKTSNTSPTIHKNELVVENNFDKVKNNNTKKSKAYYYNTNFKKNKKYKSKKSPKNNYNNSFYKKKKYPSYSNNATLINKQIDENNSAKNHDFHNYFCVWRMYLTTNHHTKKQNIKRFWIVIGEGHKNYRKFETQAEAIRYFRNLKKYAKMKVQSIKNKKFNRTVYTFLELMHQGIDLNNVRYENREYNNFDKNKEYEDEYTHLDLKIDNNQDLSDTLNEKEIDELILEKEGDTLVLDYKLDIFDEDEEEKVNREIIFNKNDEFNDTYDETVEEEIISNSNPTYTYSFETKTYEVASDEKERDLFVTEEETKDIEDEKSHTEIILFENLETINNHNNTFSSQVDKINKNTLYDLVTEEEKDSINEINEILNDDYDEFNITQHNTIVSKVDNEFNLVKKSKIKNKNKRRLILSIWVIFSFIILIGVMIILILWALKIIPFNN